MNMKQRWNNSDRVKPVHVPLLSTTNPVWIGFGSNSSLHDETDRRLSACNNLVGKVARRFDARCHDVSPSFNLLASLHYRQYNRSNFTRSPASGAGNVSKPRLMSQVGRVRVDQCVSAIRDGGGANIRLLTQWLQSCV
jgi:hypothetical protein